MSDFNGDLWPDLLYLMIFLKRLFVLNNNGQGFLKSHLNTLMLYQWGQWGQCCRYG